MNDPLEDFVCVACKAFTREQHAFGESPDSPLKFYVCAECMGDGTFVEWLAGELERTVREEGWKETKTAAGISLWSPPEETAP